MKKLRFLLPFCVIFILCASCTAQRNNKIPDELDKIVSAAIIEKNSDKYYTAEFQTEAHTIIKTVKEDNKILIYLTFTYRGYAPKDGGGYKLCAGGYSPALLAFTETGDTYEMEEFWLPDSGTRYEASVKERFPKELWKDAFDKEAYSGSQIDVCSGKADAYFATHIAQENTKK